MYRLYRSYDVSDGSKQHGDSPFLLGDGENHGAVFAPGAVSLVDQSSDEPGDRLALRGFDHNGLRFIAGVLLCALDDSEGEEEEEMEMKENHLCF